MVFDAQMLYGSGIIKNFICLFVLFFAGNDIVGMCLEDGVTKARMYGFLVDHVSEPTSIYLVMNCVFQRVCVTRTIE